MYYFFVWKHSESSFLFHYHFHQRCIAVNNIIDNIIFADSLEMFSCAMNLRFLNQSQLHGVHGTLRFCHKINVLYAAFIKGDGSGKPTGIFTSAEAEVTISGSALTFDNVMDLYYSLRAPYRNKAVWILNDSTVKALRKLKDGNGNYIWQPSVREGEPDKILNRPYYTSVYAPELTSGNNVLAFGDFSYYWIADRQGRSFKRLNELYAPNGQVGFLASQRLDGKLILTEAVKLLKMG